MANIKTSNLALNSASETDEAGQMKDREAQKQTTGSIPGSPFRKPHRADSWMVKDKLSKEFRAVDDQDELGNLIGDAGEKLLALVDDIRKIDKLNNKELHIPQVLSTLLTSYDIAKSVPQVGSCWWHKQWEVFCTPSPYKTSFPCR